ncbi:uncharacterized protein B0T23DRAFT_397280 [Neurospora hispaniola]|uniref:Uncharacterized protein n=1 Tax=Neurospora hispaniola TaxID=588809 RepID=A0AAJ0I6Q9_9PEZI|nr:hypothetical protein B0T23DRAFT_397280 [Neurospora hispaniola]
MQHKLTSKLMHCFCYKIVSSILTIWVYYSHNFSSQFVQNDKIDMQSHSNRTSRFPTTAAKSEARPDASALGKLSSSAPAKGGSMPAVTRTIGRSTASNSVSVASVSNNTSSDTPSDDGSLQYQRLARFTAQNHQEDGTPYGRLQDIIPTTTAAANRDAEARDVFYQARAAEAINQVDSAFNSSK